ncbi:MAG: hypothetical protein ABIW31_08610 [Novosphingobium sp.]
MRPMLRAMLFAASSLTLLTTSGCNKAQTDKVEATSQPSDPIVATSAPAYRSDADRKTILAAAERFENLTEAAFDGTQHTAAALALAQQGAKTARSLLDPNEAATLDEKLARVDAAAKSHVAADIALAAIEAYRTMITASGGEGHIPLQVGLLDYAGFRFWANARAVPPRWDEMAKARFFAEGQFALISPRIHDEATKNKFKQVIDAMDKAIIAKDSQGAVLAATTEMDLVDELEKLFV